MLRPWFPTTIYQEDLNPSQDVVNSMINYTNRFDDSSEFSIYTTEVESITGDVNGDYTLHNDPSFDWLNKQVADNCRKYLIELGCDITHLNVYAQKSWAVICKNDGSIRKHCHPNSVLSAVFYLVVEDSSSSPLTFYSDKRSILNLPLNVSNGNDFNYDTAHYEPVENRLIIFPSNLYHSVDSRPLKGKRISITYDITITCDNLHNAESMILDPVYWKKLQSWEISSAVEHLVYTEGVTSSILVSPITNMSSYYFTLCVIAIFIYFIWSDPNGPRWLALQIKTLEIEIQRWILKQKIKRGMPSDMQKFIREMERKQKNDKDKM